MGILIPNLNVLPASQQLLWSRLKPTPRDFVLYGGTALALRLGHRGSVDFDFFSCRSFQPLQLVKSITYLNDQTITQQSADTLSCEVETEKGDVKISFFGGLSLRQLESPDTIASNEIAVASLKDLFGMKCATVPQRNETKDYLDIHALITQGKITLSEGIAAASAIYGRQIRITAKSSSHYRVAKDRGEYVTDSSMSASLEEIARHVNWYTEPERLLANVNLFLSQVMARGSAEDIVATQMRFVEDDFRNAYLNAPPGLFTKRAWAYWGLMLLDSAKHPLPERFPGANQFDWRKAT